MFGYEELSREELIGLLVERGVRIVELQARLARFEHLLSPNSTNSWMPPAREDDPGRTPPVVIPKTAAGKQNKGKQKGAPGANLSWIEEGIDRSEVFPEGSCEGGHDLPEPVDLGIVDRYQPTRSRR